MQVRFCCDSSHHLPLQLQFFLMPLTPTQKRAFSWLALLLGLWAVLWLLAPVLTPFVVAAILAYALTPVVDKLDALGAGRMPRVLAVVLVELVFLALLLSIALLIVPILLKQLPLLREQVPPLLNQFNDFLSPKLAALGLTVSLDVASIRAFLTEHLSANLENSVGQLLASARMGGSVALSLLGNAVLIPVVLFYLLMDWRHLVELVLTLVPPRLRPAVDSFTAEADKVLGQYLHGQLLVMGVLAVYYSVGLALFGLNLALPIGIFWPEPGAADWHLYRAGGGYSLCWLWCGLDSGVAGGFLGVFCAGGSRQRTGHGGGGLRLGSSGGELLPDPAAGG